MRSLSKWPPGGHIGFFGFQTLTLVWLWISTPNLSGTILMYMCRSLLIFSNVNFKMAARQPYWNFCFRTLTLVWLSISTANLSGTILIYSVSPIYRGRVYHGIGYIAVACWTPFFGHPFRKFRGHAAQECDFSQNRGNSLNPVRGRQFFVKSAHCGYLWSGSQETIFHEICSGPIWLTCKMQAGTHAVRWPATEVGSLTPPLYHRIGSY